MLKPWQISVVYDQRQGVYHVKGSFTIFPLSYTQKYVNLIKGEN
jgi:hypothetical protein